MFAFSSCDSGDTPPTNNENNQQTTDNNNQNTQSSGNNTLGTPTGCQHTFGSWNTVKQATCKEEGKLVRTCSKCSETEESTVAKTDIHAEVIDAAVSATCTVDGKTEGKHCSVCGTITIAQAIVKAPGHSEVVDPAVTATCNVEGKTEGKHCSECGTVTIKQNSLGYASHDYTNGVCIVCQSVDNDTKKAEIDAENNRHEEKIQEITDAYLWLVQTNEERIAELKTQHNISYVYDNLTCYEKVSELQTDISDLSQRISRLESYNDPSDLSTIASLKNQKKAKETEKEKYEAMISIHRYEDAILSHTDTYNSDIEKENSLNETNLSMIEKKYDCYVKKHTVVTLEGESPTCENIGTTEGLKCETCNVILVKQLELPAIGHTSNDETGKCNSCGANLFEAGLVFVLNDSGTGYIVSDYTGTNTTINIPDIYKGLPVVAIGHSAFYKCVTLESISLPDSITSIGNSAFYWCEKLKQIDIGPNVQFIDKWAFHYCISLESINFNATELSDFSANNYVFSYAGQKSGNLVVTIGSNVKRIPNYLFNAGENVYVKTVIFENNAVCVSIGQNSFSACPNLETLTLSNNITNIGMFAFSGVGLKSFVIPDSVTDIGYGAFQSCSKLESVTVGTGLQTVGSSAFSSCDKLSKVYIKDLAKWCDISFESFGSNPLNCSTLNCENHLYLNGVLVAEITTPEGVETIGDFVFERCYDVTEVVISEGVKTIGKYAFRACTKMTTLTISSTVTKIELPQFVRTAQKTPLR